MPVRATTVDKYLANLPADQRDALERLRALIQKAAPAADEGISYGVPAFRQHGALVGFGATQNHCAFYLMSGSTVAAYQALLQKYDVSKGTIRFAAQKGLPAALVRKLVRARLAENLTRRPPATTKASATTRARTKSTGSSTTRKPSK